MKPPIGGPMTGPIRAGTVSQASALRISDFGTERSRISRPTGTIIAPPRPCSARASTKAAKVPLKPQRIEPSVKTAMAEQKMVRAPNRSAIQPDAGMKTARLMR